MLHQLLSEQFIPAEPGRVWDYFATPKNLNEITPPELRFRIVGPVPAGMYAGQLIRYRISPLPGVWMDWLTEIRHVEPGRYFVDEQRFGPYKFWYHEHRFQPQGDGVLMTDRVTYDVGWGPFGRIAEKVWIGRQLGHIFDFRRQKVERVFGRAAGS